MMHLSLLAYPDCAMSGIIGSIDAFSIANRWAQLIPQHKDSDETLFKWDIVTPDGMPVKGEGEVVIQPHCAIHDVQDTDFIMIPGFLPPFDFIGRVPEKLTEWIQKWHTNNTMIASTCTGTFLLAETGILDNKVATTNWAFARNFQKLYPSVKLQTERILTEDSGIICSGATTSFLDLCLYLIEKYGSEELATCCSRSLLMEPGRRSQSPYFIFDYQKDHSDEKIMEAQVHLEEKFTETISLEALASDLGISPRHFKRRFKTATGDSPLTYLQRVRVEAAKRKLETTMTSIDEITWQVGYEDSNSFRKLFKKHTGLSPTEYRGRFTRTRGSVLL